jgi:plasmid stabilization system protein ParE
MPTKYEVSFSRKAEEDIEEIWSFIAEESPDEATRFIQKLGDQVGTLERFPERCPMISENQLMHSRYRHLIYGNYRTIFRISQRTVHVLRIIHSGRLLDASVLESTAAE